MNDVEEAVATLVDVYAGMLDSLVARGFDREGAATIVASTAASAAADAQAQAHRESAYAAKAWPPPSMFRGML